MQRKKRFGRLLSGLLGVFAVSLIIVGIIRLYASIAKQMPVPQSQLSLAQEGITHNAGWDPIIRQFNGLDWVLVPAGCFRMGSSEAQLEAALGACKTYGGNNCPYVFDMIAQPDSEVCFEKPFWIGATEVTNRQYGSSSSTDMISMYRGSNWPRETITWQDAVHFCEHANARLPAEAEWEYAARGPDEWLYPWGNEMSPFYREQAELLNPQNVRSVSVDRSWVGAQGMTGNVMEWTSDLFDPSTTPVQNKSTASNNGEQRVVRGGSWASYADFLLRTTQRIPYAPNYTSSVLGFRCARDFDDSH